MCIVEMYAVFLTFSESVVKIVHCRDWFHLAMSKLFRAVITKQMS